MIVGSALAVAAIAVFFVWAFMLRGADQIDGLEVALDRHAALV